MLSSKKLIALMAFVLAISPLAQAQCVHPNEQCPNPNTPFPDQPVTLGLLEAVRNALNLPAGTCRQAIGVLPNEGCYAPTEKILARTMMMDFLWELRNFTVDAAHPVNSLNAGARAQYDRYIGCIIAMIRTQASFINLAGKRYGGSARFRYNDVFFCMIRQVTTDINAAYDCAGLPRPVIQGAVMEVVDLNVGQNQVRICTNIIELFRDEIIAAGQTDYYFTRENNGTLLVPRENLFFRRENIVFSVSSDPKRADGTRPNIMNVECRMFYFHCAKLQMDAGYSALAMGFMKDWAEADAADGELNTTYSIFQRIRGYAQGKGLKMLITAEPGENLKNYVTHPTIPGAKLFLFDYASVPLRPREINLNNPHDDPDGYPCNGNDYPYDQEDIALFQRAPCLQNAALGAVFDKCTLDAFTSHNNVEGYTPNGCLTSKLPLLAYFDYAEGEKWKGCIDSNELRFFPNFMGPGDEGPGTWGYADCNWLAQLTPECRAAWFSHTFCRLREMSNGTAFMQIPGLVFLPHREADCLDHTNATPFERDWFYIGDTARDSNQALLNAAIAVTSVLQTPPIIEETNKYFVEEWCDVISDCTGQVASPGHIYHMKKFGYKFCVRNPDCTSAYSWHIRTENGTWLPLQRGNCIDFIPPRAGTGTYIIGLRADNTGFPNTWGALLTPADVTLNNSCQCTEILLSQSSCWKKRITCSTQDNDMLSYDYEIALDKRLNPENVHLTSSVGLLTNSEFNITDNVLTGRYKIPTLEPVKKFDVYMNYKSSSWANYEAVHIVEDLENCQQSIEERDNSLSSVQETFKIRPNPANKYFVMEGIENQSKYVIFNASGLTIATGIYSVGEKITIENYEPGLYFVKVVSPTRYNIQAQRIIISAQH